MFDDVVEFQTTVLKAPKPEVPTLVSHDWVMDRYRFLNEEATEFLDNGMNADLVGVTDALLDSIYVALGALYRMGIPVQQCWDAVHAANMRKKSGVKAGRTMDFDAVKPPGWVGPEADIAIAIGIEIDKDTRP